MKTNNLLKLSVFALLATFVTLTACKKDEEDDNKIPSVEIIRPDNNTSIYLGETLNVKVEATDTDGTIAQVAIFIENVEMAVKTESPYEFYISTDELTGGTKELKAVATDNTQATGEEIISITIIEGSYPPTCDFSVNRTINLSGRKFNFTGTATNDPTEWLWDFGDGNTSTEINPTHIYTQEGTYTVSLTVTNEDGSDIETKTDLITVYPVEMIELVTVDGGTFEMGSDTDSNDDNPVHTVTLDGFKIGKYEVTNEQYVEFLNTIKANADGSYNNKQYVIIENVQCKIEHNGVEFITETSYENHPAYEITWYGARAFCDYYGYSLPTEAQWEYAARGGKEGIPTTFAGSNTLSEVGWYNANSGYLMEVGLLAPNEIGTYDMSGNAWEWCNDYYSETYYSTSPTNNPTGPTSGEYIVTRGGGAFYYAAECTVSIRWDNLPDGYWGYGFRVALPDE